ncbi:MAG: hypothetical protein WCI51_10865 [Lentisphaerota bacterium]
MKVLFIFCEGPDDSSFCHLVLQHALSIRGYSVPCYHEYPSPLDGIFKKTIENMHIQDGDEITLLPRMLYDYSDNLKIIIVEMKGQDNLALSKKLLAKISTFSYKHAKHYPTFDGVQETDIEDYKFLFTFDADYMSVSERIDKWKNDFSDVSRGWNIENHCLHANNVSAIAEDKAIYVWKTDTETSTLEDIVISLLSDNNTYLISQAEEFVNYWPWTPSNPSLESKSKVKAEKLKAILTIAGQKHRPGRGLPPIIQDYVKGPNKKELPAIILKLNNNSHVKQFSAFVKEFIEQGWI